MENRIAVVERIREFNRFYTVLIGTLNNRFLGTEFSVTETRILFELLSNDGCSANLLVNKLHIDKSYMSRILKSFEKRQLIRKQTSDEDRRAQCIYFTEKGIQTIQELIAVTNNDIGGLIQTLSDEECREVCRAMDTITTCLSKE